MRKWSGFTATTDSPTTQSEMTVLVVRASVDSFWWSSRRNDIQHRMRRLLRSREGGEVSIHGLIRETSDSSA
jgi:hypothetical protein